MTVLVKDLINLINCFQGVRIKENNKVVLNAESASWLRTCRPEFLDREVMHLDRFTANRNGKHVLTFTIYKKSDQS
jgi:hypothetical protein